MPIEKKAFPSGVTNHHLPSRRSVRKKPVAPKRPSSANPPNRSSLRGLASNCASWVAESFAPLNYKKQGEIIDLSFWRAPERLFDEPDELVEWARIALEAARRVAAKTSRKSRRQPV
jgi:hypothetical protein